MSTSAARFEDRFLTRRDALRIGSAAVAGGHAVAAAQPQARAPRPPAAAGGRARFCIFAMLEGGQSHTDSWDLKEGPWTPVDFSVQTLSGVGKWPMGLYPELGKRREKYALVRSMANGESRHVSGQHCMQTGRSHDPALSPQVPGMGSVVAYERAPRRKSSDWLPPFVSLNTLPWSGLAGSGFLPARYAPFHMRAAPHVSSPGACRESRSGFDSRWEPLRQSDGQTQSDPRPSAGIFEISGQDKARYGSNPVGDSFALARNLVMADAGTHFIFLAHEGWDHHGAIYRRGNFYQRSKEIDTALSRLLDDLEQAKREDGTSVLDETLVVCAGEFGRAPGALNSIAGRDHHPHAFSGLFAGGGIAPGQVLGATDGSGAQIKDFGWSGNRPVYPGDMAATIYAAMGIDRAKSIAGRPLARMQRRSGNPSSASMPAGRVVRELFA